MVSLKTPEASARDAESGRGLVWVYGAWSFVASLLIFWVELMVAKMLLPAFGGSPSVWNTALVFFQINLLAGYAGAHFLARLDSRRHKLVQSFLVAVPVLVLPVALPTFLDSQGFGPTVAVLVALTMMVGAPFFALATSTPTLQAWFSHSSHPKAGDPYFLYALSNVGSVVGLLGYPLLIERVTTLQGQTLLWAGGYVAFAALTIVGSRLVGEWEPVDAEPVEKPPVGRRLRWAAIAFVPSLALLGVTRHISTDVAAFPLLWTIPLAVYLASFVVTFRSGGERWTEAGQKGVRLLVVPTAVFGVSVLPDMLWMTAGVTMLLLAAVSVAGHGMVYADRPEAGALTHFYLWVSIGGAAGGLFASILAPLLFDSVIEYSLALVLSALLVARPLRGEGMRQPLVAAVVGGALVVAWLIADAGGKTLLLGVAGLMAILWLQRSWLAAAVAGILVVSSLAVSADVLDHERTFFGVYRVHEADGVRVLTNGTTLHGSQLTEGDTTTPTSYYGREGPAGDVFTALGDSTIDVGVVGLGVGALVSYGGQDDSFTFYEIDPVVEELARDERFFTMLSDSSANVEVVIGDGRLELEDRDARHDLLVVDAFSSDAIPVHLLTLEAFESYMGSIVDDGTLLIHVSNRHLQLAPVVGRIAEELGVPARVRLHEPGPHQEWASTSMWMVLDKGEPLDLPSEWERAAAGASLWTDDYSNIASVIDWN